MGLYQRSIDMIQRLLKSSFLKFTSIVFVGNFFAQIIIFIAFALFAHHFDKVEIGIYTVFISLSILLAVPATGRYELAIMLPKIKSESTSLLFTAISLAFLFSVLLYFILLFLPLQHFFLKLEKLDKLITVLPIGVFLMAAYQSFINYNNKFEQFMLNAAARFLQAISMLGLSFYIAMQSSYSAYALVLAWISSQTLVLILFIIQFIVKKNTIEIHGIIALLKKYKRYPTISLVSNTINTFSLELPNYFIPMFWGASTQTLYAYGNRVAAMPRNFIASAIGEVFYNTSSKIACENPKMLLPHLLKISKALIAFSSVIYIIGILSSKFLFPIVFGQDYIEAVPFFNWIAIASIFMFVQSPISVISDVVNKLQPPLYYNLIAIIIKVSTLVFAGVYFDSAVQMIALYSLANALLSISWILYIHKMAKDFTLSHSL